MKVGDQARDHGTDLFDFDWLGGEDGVGGFPKGAEHGFGLVGAENNHGGRTEFAREVGEESEECGSGGVGVDNEDVEGLFGDGVEVSDKVDGDMGDRAQAELVPFGG